MRILFSIQKKREGSFLVLFHMVWERDNLPPVRMPVHIFLTSLNRRVNSAVKSVLKESDLGLKKLHKGGESYKGIACKKRFKKEALFGVKNS